MEHECDFIVPAGDHEIYDTCGQSEPDWLRNERESRELQPPDTDRNGFDLVKQSRSLINMDNGIVIDGFHTATINVAKTRAERRRREKERQKQPLKPVLIGSRTADLGKPNHQTIAFDGPVFHGPGVMIVVAHPVRKTEENPQDQRLDPRQLAKEYLPKA